MKQKKTTQLDNLTSTSGKKQTKEHPHNHKRKCKEVEPEETLFETTVNGEQKKYLLKDIIWETATGRKIPNGMKVVWKDGLPHSIGEKGCTFENIKLVLDD